MTYFLKQHFLTWGERFAICDESARNRYFVDSELFAVGKLLKLLTLGGNEIAQIKQQVWSFSPAYEITREGKGTVKLVASGKQFRAKSVGLTVEGAYEDHSYTVKDKEGAVLCTVSKKWFTLGEAYGIDIASGADTELMLAIVLAIEARVDKRDKHRE